jgi:crossover junction endodeoxyribonuclease RuvC
VIGIDPGKSGGLVVLDELGTVHAAATADRWVIKGRGNTYVPRTMAEWLTRIPCDLVVIEAQQARPAQGRSSILTTGIGLGLWLGIAATLELPYLEVSPARWTRAILSGQAGEGKERGIAVCRARVPGLDLTPGRKTKPHDGLADAACLALYGLRELGR